MVSRAQVLSPMVEAKAALRLGPVTRDALARTVRGALDSTRSPR